MTDRVTPWIDRFRSVLAVGIFTFNIWAVLTFDFDDVEIRATFLAFTLAYAFAFYPPTASRRRWVVFALDMAALAISLYITFYVASDFEAVFDRAGSVRTLDMVVASAAVVLVLESTRRTAGWALPLMSLAFLLYPLVYGPYIPGLLRTAQFGLERVLTAQYLSLEGILGIALRVMIDYIFLFIVFGAFLQRFGITEFFIDLSRAIAGGQRGGSAKVAVVSSALMGTVSGSAVANVVSTGVVTIPMMRREGFRATFAGAVEAAASTGGQIMPPIMGAAAFLMAEFARIPYSQIVIHALIPATLYFGVIFAAVHFEARRLKLHAEKAPDEPRAKDILRERGAALIPLVLVTALIMAGNDLAESVLLGIAATLAVAAVVPRFRPMFTLANIVGAIREGVDNSISLFTAAACSGIVIGIIALTGIGLKISTVIIDVSLGLPMIALLLSALTCLVMGLGLPTQIIYLTLAILVAPGLVEMGIGKPGAHLFIMYFGMMSMVTPPVCFAAFAAASISGASLMETGVAAFRLALAGQFIPFYFAFNQGLLFVGSAATIAGDIARTCIGLFAAGMAFEIFRLRPFEDDRTMPRPLKYARRLLFGAASVLLILPDILPTATGLGCCLMGVLLAYDVIGARRVDEVERGRDGR